MGDVRTKIDRIGEENININGTCMKIIDYINANKVVIEFQDEYKYQITTTYSNFKKGKIKNPYDKTIFGIGFLGIGKYTEKSHPRIYDTWYNMLKRCYSIKFKQKHETYTDCISSLEFHCFQNFGEWYDANYYEIKGEIMCLDKDILIKNNKVYSANTCIFVPNRINMIIVSRDSFRNNLPIGVSYNTRKKKYRAYCSIIDENGDVKQKHLGYYDFQIDAFEAYKTYKEAYIKLVAEQYKNMIPEKLYNALYNFHISIND